MPGLDYFFSPNLTFCLELWVSVPPRELSSLSRLAPGRGWGGHPAHALLQGTTEHFPQDL